MSKRPVPSVAEEQSSITNAYRCLDAMRERTQRALDQAETDAKLTDAFDAAAIQHQLRQRLAAVADSKAPLTFGRIDETGSFGAVGDRHYIGRRHVEDHNGDPVVVDWRAPVAAPFYRATWADPCGLDHRSRFALEGRELIGIFDEDFNDPEGEGKGGGGVPDPLLAELDRARTGAMRDIVATIQAEQDAIIRAPLADLVVVQGGPGTGKTAVGLHRAAYLLYAHRAEFERRRLLVVGPNRLFLTYISQVLPSLGETSVVQGTIETLMARYVVRAVEARDVTRLKGDPRMAELIRRFVTARLSSGPIPDLDVMTPFGGAQVPAREVAEILEVLLERQLAYGVARGVFRDHLVSAAWKDRLARTGVPEQQFTFTDALRSSVGLKQYLDAVWPMTTAPAVVRSLLGNKRQLAAVAEGLLTKAEQASLHRKPAKKAAEEQWTRADLALLDEANHLLTGDTATFGHVVVDEAQDLSAMELRLVGRRSADRSLTVLGDLAQSTTVGGQSSWDAALAALGHGKADVLGRPGTPAVGRVEVLDLGYRVPESIIDFANRLLPLAAPDVPRSRSVRAGGSPPELVHLGVNPIATIAARIDALRADYSVIGVLVPPSMIDAAVNDLRTYIPDLRDARREPSIEEGVTVVAAELSKGLEFDAVVVVEPAAIVRDNAEAGLRVLYVALTRATQRVVICAAEPLPTPLSDDAAVLATAEPRSGSLV